jgi:hypothetical protein
MGHFEATEGDDSLASEHPKFDETDSRLMEGSLERTA